MKILILIGSGDIHSHSLGLGKAIEEAFVQKGAEVELVNLVEHALPLYDRSVERQDRYDDKTRSFLEKSHAADAFVWVTPIYHNSFSSILKNALDWQHTKFPGKVVAMASNGGHRSPQAVDQLMLVARAQHMLSARTRVCTSEEDYNDKMLSDSTMADRVVALTDEVIELVGKLGI